jgi:calcium-dependent protein kinase
MIAEKDEDNITKEEYFWIKIVDFQTDANFQNNEKQKNLKENSYYSSPESLKNNYIDKSDVWSVGVILHIALTGKFPYDGENEEEINYKIMNINYNILDPRLFAHSPEVKDLLDKLLQKDINNRLSAKEALEHEWFKNYNGRALFNNFKLDEIQHYINNLCNYSLESKIYQLVIAFIVHNMSYPSYIYTIQKIYRYFNLSGNCKLTKDELKKGLYNYRSETQIDSIVDKLFVLLDGDNNGYIEFEEFLRACIDKNKILTKENLWYAFKFLDKKNKNSIDAQTLMRAFDAKPNKMLEAVFNKTLNDGDLDNNREISFEEFEEIMKNTLK